MKILFIHNDYGKRSGEEHACEAIAEMCFENGHEVVWYRRSSEEIAGSALGYTKAFFTALHNPVATKAVGEIVDREKPDLAYVQNLYPLISPSVLRTLKRRGIPIVMRCPNYRLFCPNGLHFVHGAVCEKCLGGGRELWCVLRNCEHSMPKSIGYALRNAVARLRGAIVDTVDTFIVLTEFQKSRFVTGGISRSRLCIVPNMIPESANVDIEPDSGSVVGYIGRMAEEKGFSDFVEAARRLPHLKFAAAGVVKAGYDKVLTDLPPNLKMVGFLVGHALERFVAEMQILVMCSSCFEGFPNTIAQAMAAGRPVVATAIGAMPEIVDAGETGLLYAPKDVDTLVRHVVRLTEDEELRRCMGESGRKKALSLYSHAAVYEALMEAFEKAIEKGGVE